MQGYTISKIYQAAAGLGHHSEMWNMQRTIEKCSATSAESRSNRPTATSSSCPTACVRLTGQVFGTGYPTLPVNMFYVLKCY